MPSIIKTFIPLMSLGFFAFGIPQAQALIIVADNFKSVISRVEGSLKDTPPQEVLLCLDTNLTLIQTDHPATFYPSLRKHQGALNKIFDSLTPEKRDLVLAYVSYTIPQRAIEKEAAEIVKDIQNKGVKVIAVTSALTGEVGRFILFEEFIRELLKSKGFDFESSFPGEKITFTALPAYRNYHPTFYKGILSTNGDMGPVRKGRAIKNFLKMVSPQTKVVIMVDDREKSLLNVQATLREFYPQVKFIGIHYTPGLKYQPQTVNSEEFKKFWDAISKEAM
jgi:hypothetical protein